MVMKQATSNNPTQTVIHLCRSIEYRGGVESFLVDFVCFEKSISHVLICTEGAPGVRTKRLMDQGIPVYHITGSFYKTVSKVCKIAEKYDNPILHSHLFRPEMLGIFIRGCRRKITTKYCTYASDSQVGKGLAGYIHRFIDNHFIDHIITPFYDDIIVITDELQRKWRFLKNRLQFVPISTIRSYVMARPSRILGTDLILIAATRMVREKQHDLLLESIKQIRFKKLYLLGDGPLREQIKQYLKDENIQNVEMPGAVPRHSVFEYMDKSDVLLLTSKTEGLPLLVQEAMSRGLPVVATEVGGIRHLVDDQTGVVVSDNNPESFAKGINSLIGRDIGKMSRAAINKCKKRCSFDITCRLITDIYTG